MYLEYGRQCAYIYSLNFVTSYMWEESIFSSVEQSHLKDEGLNYIREDCPSCQVWSFQGAYLENYDEDHEAISRPSVLVHSVCYNKNP